MRKKFTDWLHKDPGHSGVTWERKLFLAMATFLLSAACIGLARLLLKDAVFQWIAGAWFFGPIWLAVHWGYKLGQSRGLQRIVDIANGPYGTGLRQGFDQLKKEVDIAEQERTSE